MDCWIDKACELYSETARVPVETILTAIALARGKASQSAVR